MSDPREIGSGDEKSKHWWKNPGVFIKRPSIRKTLSDPSQHRLKIFKPTSLPLSDSHSPPSQALPWTELEEDGALYNTLLKKVRYRSHTLEDLDETDCSFMQWETVKVKQLKAANLDKLVEHLTPALLESFDFDPGFLLAFLCTYKSFSTTTQIVDLLLKRFELHENNHASPECDQQTAEGIIRRICSVISIWIDQYPRDFDEPPNFDNLTRLIKFTEQRKQLPSVTELYNRCENKLTTLSVSPFDDEKPFRFKFCSCISVIGCTCARSNSFGREDKLLDIRDYHDDFIAEQLTLVDADLFLRVNPRESLAYFWSKRDSAKGAKAQSIKLTVDQFNAVSLKVSSTVLNARDTKSKCHSSFARSKIIMKWIEVALELRELKNFSSLKAILSGLQSTAIYRLNSSWDLVSKYSKEVYKELSEIFSNDLNQKASRDLLVQEGTAKYSTNSLRKSKSKRQSWIKEGRTHGTVPYLGTFLTDLMMIDTAFPDKIRGDLINFEKRRKEFEIVVQIKLLQQAAKNYNLSPTESFFIWFNSIETYTDKSGYDRSLEVEPPPPKIEGNNKPLTPQPTKKAANIKRYLSESDIFQRLDSMSFAKTPTPSDDSLMTDSLHSLVSRNNLKAESLSCRMSLDPSDTTPLDNSGVVARVYLEDAADIRYKSIKILPNHKAADVISSTLIKFKSENDVMYYSLYQVIDNKKSLHIPMNSNMYYAMSKCKELCFKVAKKKLSKKAKKTMDATVAAQATYSPTKRSSSVTAFPFQLTNAIAIEDPKPSRSISLKSYSPI